MNRDMSKKTLGIIHASHITIKAVEPYIKKFIPEVDCIVIAQLSMSVLAPCLKATKVPVYNSRETGFLGVRKMLEKV